MSQRLLLRKHFYNAWVSIIRGPYSQGLINSERGLQVHYCIALFEQFETSTVSRRLFIEPSMKFQSGPIRYPDLVICNTKSIIGVVEFKYTPCGIPRLGKDIKTLEMLAKAKEGVEISNDRFRGKTNTLHRYAVSPDAVLCWAGVYAGEGLVLPADRLGRQFLRLDARTAHGSDAVLNCGEPDPEAV